MPSEGKQEKQSDSLVDQLLTNEDLQYNLPSSATVVVEKNTNVYFTHINKYDDSSDRLVTTLNTGANFIDGRNSFLAFNLKCNATVNTSDTDFIDFGQGSAANLFSELIIRSRDGSELERIRAVNVLTATRNHWTKSNDWFQNIGSQMGYSPDLLEDDDGKTASVGRYKKSVSPQEFTTQLTTTGIDFVIPLAEISGLFDNPALLPSHLMSGLRIELVFEKASTIFRSYGVANSPVTGFTMTGIELRMQTLRLADSIMNQLTTNASFGGLSLAIKTWDLTTSGTAGFANIEVRRNLSQLLSVLVKNRVTTDISLFDKDSMASEAVHAITSYRLRHGSSFIPNSKVEKRVQMYALAQIAFNKFKRSSGENNVSLQEYWKHGKSVISHDLERSSIDLSGKNTIAQLNAMVCCC